MIWKVYQKLLEVYGNQNWWPAETPFEVCVGAILTQNTNWKNVEKSIQNLKKNRLLTPESLIKIPPQKLEALIKPSGFFRQKAQYLKNLSQFILEEGGIESLKKKDTKNLREKLLKVKGIGKETADSILLYALDKKIFIVDAYTKRLFHRLGILEKENESYEKVKELVEKIFKDNNAKLQDYKEFHALIVKHCKFLCKKKADCQKCFLKEFCGKIPLTKGEVS